MTQHHGCQIDPISDGFKTRLRKLSCAFKIVHEAHKRPDEI